MPSVTDWHIIGTYENNTSFVINLAATRDETHTADEAGLPGQVVWPFMLGNKAFQNQNDTPGRGTGLAGDPLDPNGLPPEKVMHAVLGGVYDGSFNSVGSRWADQADSAARVFPTPRPQIWTYEVQQLADPLPADDTITWHWTWGGTFPYSGPVTVTDRYAHVAAGKFTPRIVENDPPNTFLTDGFSEYGYGTAVSCETWEELYWDEVDTPWWLLIVVAWTGAGITYTPATTTPTLGTTVPIETVSLDWPCDAYRYAIYTPKTSAGFPLITGTLSSAAHWGITVQVFEAYPEAGGYVPQMYRRMIETETG